MDKDKLVINRILDLANTCYNRGIPVATDFLDLNSQTIFCNSISKLPPVSYVLTGGYSFAERKQIVFFPSLSDEQQGCDRNFTSHSEFGEKTRFFDIIKIESADTRYSEPLNHRDYLGAIMNLGIAREKFGDIIVNRRVAVAVAYLFATKKIGSYIIDNLIKIRNTIVTCSIINELDFDIENNFESIQGTIASIRLDSIIALGFNSSRSQLIHFIEEGKVSVNGKIITTNAYNINNGDIISVRGMGKIRFDRVISSTKKGRILVSIDKYI